MSKDVLGRILIFCSSTHKTDLNLGNVGQPSHKDMNCLSSKVGGCTAKRVNDES